VSDAVTASFWRAWFMILAFKFRKVKWGNLFWRAARWGASDAAHKALSAVFTGQMLAAVGRGEFDCPKCHTFMRGSYCHPCAMAEAKGETIQ